VLLDLVREEVSELSKEHSKEVHFSVSSVNGEGIADLSTSRPPLDEIEERSSEGLFRCPLTGLYHERVWTVVPGPCFRVPFDWRNVRFFLLACRGMGGFFRVFLGVVRNLQVYNQPVEK